MALGKFSPTVLKSYALDSEWFKNYAAENEEFDHDGYDQFGYNKFGMDREGIHEEDYNSNESLYREKMDAWEKKMVIGTPEYFEDEAFDSNIDQIFNTALEKMKFQDLTLKQKKLFVKFFETL